MNATRIAILVAAAIAILTPAPAAAQEPVRDFSQLNTRLRPGDTIWVTDAQGRETKGRILSLSADELVLEGQGDRSFGSPDVATIDVRRSDSLGNGALVGLGVGGGLTLGLCLASAEGSDRGWCPLAALFYGGVGAAIGVGIDAMIPGKKLVAYRAPGAGSGKQARVWLAPFVTPRTKGAALTFSF